MGGVANAVGVGPVLTIEVGGKEYELAPLKMKDLAKVEKYAKKVRRAEALETIRQAGDLLTSEQVMELVKDLATENDSWLEFIPTPAGIEYVIALRLSLSYPAMTEEELKELITVEAVSKVEAEMDELLGLDAFRAFAGESDGSPNAESG
jgi:hypothetical protein